MKFVNLMVQMMMKMSGQVAWPVYGPGFYCLVKRKSPKLQSRLLADVYFLSRTQKCNEDRPGRNASSNIKKIFWLRCHSLTALDYLLTVPSTLRLIKNDDVLRGTLPFSLIIRLNKCVHVLHKNFRTQTVLQNVNKRTISTEQHTAHRACRITVVIVGSL